MKSTRTRIGAITAAVACVVGVVAMVVPTSGASLPSAVRLHLGTDSQHFSYGTTIQSLSTAKNGCQLTSDEPIIDLSSTPAQSDPGLASNSLGVKATKNSSNGTPCSQVDAAETLRLTRGPALGNRQFSAVRLDLEMTSNAVVALTLSSSTTSAVYRLQTGTSIQPAQAAEPDYDTVEPYFVSSGPGDQADACASPNSSGPNSAGSDNCQWTVDPGFDFDVITLTTELGTVSLEGSSDFGNDPSFDTMLYLANTAPVANDDTFPPTVEDVAAVGNVLANDTDAEDNPLTASVLTGPVNGTLVLSPNGGFTYTPDPDWFGTDSFTYTASDGSATDSATATINVLPVNDPPVAVSSSTSVDEDSTVNVRVATDVDSTVLDADCTSDAGGSITDEGDGTITFAPALDFNGAVEITCTVTDDQGATAAATATIQVGVDPVNDAPVADDDVADVDADRAVDIDVLANDSDVDGDALGVTGIANVAPAGATAVANPDNTITYTPPAGYVGAGSFTYRATDGELDSAPATVDVTVFPVICSTDSVTDSDGDVSGTFTRLSDPFECKRYELEASDEDDAVLFQPQGDSTVSYRGVLTLGTDAAPAPGGPGSHTLLLRYDPTGGTTYQPVQWCIDPQFDGGGNVTSATLPVGQTWCIASATTTGTPSGDLMTTWQVYGEDDPRFTR